MKVRPHDPHPGVEAGAMTEPRYRAPTVEVLQLVRVNYLIGEGVEGDPVRVASDYYDLQGDLVVRVDPYLLALAAVPATLASRRARA